MGMRTAVPASIDEYIAASPADVRPILKEIRRRIRAAAPAAEEVISYRMPAFRQGGILVYFAAFKNHIGLFPPVSGDPRLEKALAPYAGPKGNLKFPLDRTIPYARRADRASPREAGARSGGPARSDTTRSGREAASDARAASLNSEVERSRGRARKRAPSLAIR